jgi:hypothetical protein
MAFQVRNEKGSASLLPFYKHRINFGTKYKIVRFGARSTLIPDAERVSATLIQRISRLRSR